MNEKNNNAYDDLMKCKEIDLYKCNNIKNKELNQKDINEIMNSIMNNLKKSKNVLKNYAVLIFINKKYKINKNQIRDCKQLYNIFVNDFTSYIDKYKIEKGKIKEKDKIKDSIPHETHMDIRKELLEIMIDNLDCEQDINEFIKDKILLPLNLFQFEYKKKFVNLLRNNKIEIVNELLIGLEQTNKPAIFSDINDLLFYEYLFLEINHLSNNDNKGNYLDYKEKKNEKNLKNRFEILSIKTELKDLRHIKSYFRLFYKQREQEIIKEMSYFLFKLFNFKNNIDLLCELNKEHLKKNIDNAIKLYMYLIEEIENNYLEKNKSHISLCKKNIININDFNFFGNTRVDEIIYYLNEKIPENKKNQEKGMDVYYELNIKINDKEVRKIKEEELNKTLNELKENNMQLNIYKKEINKERLFEDNQLTEKFKEVLEQWFDKYSDLEVMNAENASKFISKVTKKPFSPESIKVLDFLKKNGSDKKLLERSGFINFYYRKCKIGGYFKIISENVKNMNFYSDLNKMNKVDAPKDLDIYNLIYKLSNEKEKEVENEKEKYNLYIMDDLKEICKNKIDEKIFDFILSLSTNEKAYNNVLNNFNKDEKMKLTNNKGNYIDNMYTLIIIENIFENIALKKNDKYKKLEIISEKYLLFDNYENNKIFYIEYIKNNYNDLLKYISTLLNEIIKNKNKNEHLEHIVIRCCIKGFELANNIYNSYYRINYEKDNKESIFINSPSNLINENNLQNYIENNEIYNDLLNQIFIFFNKYFYSLKVNEKTKYILLLLENIYCLLFSLLYTNKNIFEYINKNEDNKKLLKTIILDILTLGEDNKYDEFLKKFFIHFFDKNEQKISSELLSYLINLTFSFEDDYLQRHIRNNELFYKYLNSLSMYTIDTPNKNDLKNKLLSINEKIYNYFKSKSLDIIKEEPEDSLIGNYILVLMKSIDGIEKLKEEIIFNKVNNEKTLYRLFMDIFIDEDNKRMESIKDKYKSLEDLLKSSDDKFINYEEIKNKNNEIDKINDDIQSNNLIKQMIAFCSFCLTSKENIKEIIKILNEFKKLDDEKANLAKKSNDKRILKRKKYVGLKNLGNICYLNSVIQQLFMIPHFRYSIMSIDDKKEKIKTDLLDDDNALHQLQRMFTYLMFTSFGEFLPKDFICSLQSIIMPNSQQDSQEFYSNFCDVIEKCIFDTKEKNLINDLFIGKICYLNKCKKCGFSSYRYDTFKNLTLDVEGIGTIEESLLKYISPEIIEDYRCQNCSNTVNLEKRAFLANLPNILIVHLRRIVMNYEEGRAEKINSRFEFKQKLQLKEYCIEKVIDQEDEDIYKKKDDYYEYDLKGINIHKGSAEGGHYISIIKIGKDIDDNEKEDIWYEFNDSCIRQIVLNEEYLEKECYGGKNEDSDEDSHHNAYLLFYELKKKKPMKIMLDEREINNSEDVIDFDQNNQKTVEKQYDVTKLTNPYNEKELVNKYFYNKDNNSYYQYKSYNDFIKKIPKEYLMEVIKDNKLYDFLKGKGRVIDFNNYLIKIILNGFKSNISDIIDFETIVNLIDISISAIISDLYNDNKNNNSNNLQNISIIINQIILPSLQNDNNDQKLRLLQLINNNLFNNNSIILIFNNNKITKEIPEQIYELLKHIIKLNTPENNETILLNVHKIINDEDKVSNYLYNISYELITNIKTKNTELLKNIFVTFYYKLYKENEEKMKNNV